MIWETRLSGSLHEIRHIPGRAKNAWCPRQLFEQWGYPSLNPVACSHIDADNTPVSTRQTPKQSLPANIAEKEGINHTTQKWTNLGKWTSNYLVVASFLLSWTWEAAKHTNHVSSYLCSNGIQQTIDAYVPSDDEVDRTELEGRTSSDVWLATRSILYECRVPLSFDCERK